MNRIASSAVVIEEEGSVQGEGESREGADGMKGSVGAEGDVVLGENVSFSNFVAKYSVEATF